MRSILSLVFALSLIACSKSSHDAQAAVNPIATGSKPVDCPANTPTDQCRSFLMSLSGKNGRPPPANVVRAAAGAVGNLVTAGKVQNYVMIQRAADGSFTSCMDPIAQGGYEAAVGEFSSYNMGNDAIWTITPVTNCGVGIF